MCYSEGKLMAYLDHQLAPWEMERVRAHLDRCAPCQGLLARLRDEREAVAGLLETYHAAVESGVCFPDRQGEVFPASGNRIKEAGTAGYLTSTKGVYWKMRRYQKALTVAAAAALVVGMFSFAPVRSFASQMLQVFRVNKVQILHFDPADVQELGKALQNYGNGAEIESFGDVQREQIRDYTRLDANTITIGSQKIYLPERLGTLQATGAMKIQEGERVAVKPKVDGINAFLKSMGSRDLLPRALDGKTFTIEVASSAMRSYQVDGNKDVTFARSISPEFGVPEGVNIKEVRAALLGIPVLPERMRNTLAGIDLGGNTLPIPDFGLARSGGAMQEVTVNGQRGVFITTDQGQTGSHSLLVWPQGAIWNALDGQFTLDEALNIAGNVIE